MRGVRYFPTRFRLFSYYSKTYLFMLLPSPSNVLANCYDKISCKKSKAYDHQIPCTAEWRLFVYSYKSPSSITKTYCPSTISVRVVIGVFLYTLNAGRTPRRLCAGPESIAFAPMTNALFVPHVLGERVQ